MYYTPVVKSWILMCRTIGFAIIGLMSLFKVPKLALKHPGSTCKYPKLKEIVLYATHVHMDGEKSWRLMCCMIGFAIMRVSESALEHPGSTYKWPCVVYYYTICIILYSRQKKNFEDLCVAWYELQSAHSGSIYNKCRPKP